MAQQTGADGSSDNRGVNPVLGVVLLSAITVTLGATAGSMMLFYVEYIDDADGEFDEKPEIAVKYEGKWGNVTIMHNGGVELEADRIVIKGDVSGAPRTWSDDGTVGIGDKLEVPATTHFPTVYVVYRVESGDDVVLASIN